MNARKLIKKFYEVDSGYANVRSEFVDQLKEVLFKDCRYTTDYYDIAFAVKRELINVGGRFLSVVPNETKELSNLDRANHQKDESDTRYMEMCEFVCKTLFGVGFNNRGKSGLTFNKFVLIPPIKLRLQGKMVMGKYQVDICVFLDRKELLGMTDIPNNVQQFMKNIPELYDKLRSSLTKIGSKKEVLP
jgi:hypothetical protein